MTAPLARRLGVLATVLLLALTVAGCSSEPPSADCPKPKGITSVGEAIPKDCILERLEGGTVRLGDLVGKPAVINFWASWCGPCIAEMPDFQRVFVTYRDRVGFIGANLLNVDGETRPVARSFAAKTKVTYPLAYDADGLLYGHFSAQLIMPVTIFVRADGVVAFRQFGPLTEARISEILRTELKVT